MARIKINRTTDNTRIRIAGRLTAADMGRLEHACAAALIVHPLRLKIDVGAVTEMDATAAAVLAQLSARGAVIQPQDRK
jgi:anti-anti-sigma regulatory factor